MSKTIQEIKSMKFSKINKVDVLTNKKTIIYILSEIHKDFSSISSALILMVDKVDEKEVTKCCVKNDINAWKSLKELNGTGKIEVMHRIMYIDENRIEDIPYIDSTPYKMRIDKLESI